jgi:hypothetical protein
MHTGWGGGGVSPHLPPSKDFKKLQQNTKIDDTPRFSHNPWYPALSKEFENTICYCDLFI